MNPVLVNIWLIAGCIGFVFGGAVGIACALSLAGCFTLWVQLR